MIESIDIADEILMMWRSFERLSSVWETLDNPEGQINCSIIDIIAKNPMPKESVVSVSAFGNYLKFMLNSNWDGVLRQPTEDVFHDWYKGRFRATKCD